MIYRYVCSILKPTLTPAYLVDPYRHDGLPVLPGPPNGHEANVAFVLSQQSRYPCYDSRLVHLSCEQDASLVGVELGTCMWAQVDLMNYRYTNILSKIVYQYISMYQIMEFRLGYK